MKFKKRYAAVVAVALTGAAVAILPMATSNAAAACAPAWSASQVYVGGNTASQSGHNYRAKWWTQNESPATHSGQWDVWADQGACGGTTPPTTPPTTGPTPPPKSNGICAKMSTLAPSALAWLISRTPVGDGPFGVVPNVRIVFTDGFRCLTILSAPTIRSCTVGFSNSSVFSMSMSMNNRKSTRLNSSH